MYYEVDIDVPGEEFLIPLVVWVEEGEDPVVKIREAVEARFPGREIPEFFAEDFADA